MSTNDLVVFLTEEMDFSSDDIKELESKQKKPP